MVETIEESTDQRQQIRLIAIIFGVVLVGLLLAYFAFLRFNFALLYSNLSAVEAASIVEELEAQSIRYRLANGGQDILVPSNKADAVRLAIVGSEAPLKGLVGFELFNDSEMGLTDFAQKIKYQRALQGELARTIMMIGGIDNARVHIAMPERTLFREGVSEPKAAVTLVTKTGQFDDIAQIAGVQRLVSAAVPDLREEMVVVLNSKGEIISSNQGRVITEVITTAEARAKSAVWRGILLSRIAAIPHLQDTVTDVLVKLYPSKPPEPQMAGDVIETAVTPEEEALTDENVISQGSFDPLESVQYNVVINVLTAELPVQQIKEEIETLARDELPSAEISSFVITFNESANPDLTAQPLDSRTVLKESSFSSSHEKRIPVSRSLTAWVPFLLGMLVLVGIFGWWRFSSTQVTLTTDEIESMASKLRLQLQQRGNE